MALEMQAAKVRHSAPESEGPDRPFGSCCSTEYPASSLEAYSVLQAKDIFGLFMIYHDFPVTYIMFK